MSIIIKFYCQIAYYYVFLSIFKYDCSQKFSNVF